MFVKARDVIRLDMTVEEGGSSLGRALAPEYRAKTAELAAGHGSSACRKSPSPEEADRLVAAEEVRRMRSAAPRELSR